MGSGAGWVRSRPSAADFYMAAPEVFWEVALLLGDWPVRKSAAHRETSLAALPPSRGIFLNAFKIPLPLL